MKLVLGADHGGVETKNALKKYLSNKGIEILDVGGESDRPSDYPLVALKAAEAYFAINADYMLLFCGTGIGISIAANKIEGIFCAHVCDETTARLAKEHNGANAIAIGGRTTTEDEAKTIVDTFLTASVDETERHERRRIMLRTLDRQFPLLRND